MRNESENEMRKSGSVGCTDDWMVRVDGRTEEVQARRGEASSPVRMYPTSTRVQTVRRLSNRQCQSDRKGLGSIPGAGMQARLRLPV